MEYIHETSQIAKPYQNNVSQTRETILVNSVFSINSPCLKSMYYVAHYSYCMKCIHEPLQMAKSYRDDMSGTRKTTLANSVFELTKLHVK